MRKSVFFFSAVIAFFCSGAMMARETAGTASASPTDSIGNMFVLDEVVVTADVVQPADNNTVMDNAVLNRDNTGQNLPYLLSSTPSLVVMSDDGLGVGYTYFRLRGTDHSRINMTVNDVPLNNSESQTVFWVNMTDMASSMSRLDIQRGVGTSANGSSSFGGSINMETTGSSNRSSQLADGRKVNVTAQFNGGMYNTFREMVNAELALPGNFRVQARISKVNSDGYLYRAASDLFSYHGSIGYYTNNTTVSLSAFGGSEKTYMAWDGVSATDLIRDHRYNPAGEYTDANGNTVYYPNQNDNYKEQHFQLHLSQRIGAGWRFKTTLHYTHGAGYYEQMKADKKYKSYGLQNDTVIDGSGKKKYYYTDNEGNSYERTNFIRQKHLDNHFYGAVFAFDYRSDKVDATIGGGGSHYIGSHWGLLHDDLYGFYDQYEYYRNMADKADANVYAKADWRIIDLNGHRLTLYGDLQYRYIYYRMIGINDEDNLLKMNILKQYHFFNPKAGLSYEYKGHKGYFNFAVANREPTRNNFKESGEHNIPLPERLYDYEFGYSYASQQWKAGANFYYMDYKNQLVLTGRYSETGACLTQNVKESFRAGIELTGSWRPVDWFEWNMALTLSRSRIKNHTDWITTYDAATYDELDQTEVNFGYVAIAFPPAVTFSNTFGFEYAGLRTDIQTNVVSKQYLDNTMSEEAMLKPYTVTNLTMRYELPLKMKVCKISLLAQVNNLFNAKYEANGGSWMCLYKDGKNYSRSYSPWYYAQAGNNVHGGITVDF